MWKKKLVTHQQHANADASTALQWDELTVQYTVSAVCVGQAK